MQKICLTSWESNAKTILYINFSQLRNAIRFSRTVSAYCVEGKMGEYDTISTGVIYKQATVLSGAFCMKTSNTLLNRV